MLKALILGTPSDAHTWNLFYLELILKESGFQTAVHGCCISYPEISKAVNLDHWDLIVVGSLNGHFYYESKQTFQAIISGITGKRPPIVAGGKIDVYDRDIEFLERAIMRQGYDNVFFGSDSVDRFKEYCTQSFKDLKKVC